MDVMDMRVRDALDTLRRGELGDDIHRAFEYDEDALRAVLGLERRILDGQTHEATSELDLTVRELRNEMVERELRHEDEYLDWLDWKYEGISAPDY